MNPASRVLAIYDKAMGLPDGTGVSLLQLWGSVFEVAENANQADEDAVTASLMVLRGEVDLASARLAERGYPSQLYVTTSTGSEILHLRRCCIKNGLAINGGYRAIFGLRWNGPLGLCQARKTSYRPKNWQA